MEAKFITRSLKMMKAMKDANLSEISNQQILDYHRKCHMLYAGNIKHTPVNKTFINSIVTFHNSIVKELLKRNIKHNTPLKKI